MAYVRCRNPTGYHDVLYGRPCPLFSATPATIDTDLMFMLDLAAGGGWPIAPALDHVKLYVDYFRAYELDDAPPVVLVGTNGNDTFFVDVSDTEIREQPGGGFDTVVLRYPTRCPQTSRSCFFPSPGPSMGPETAEMTRYMAMEEPIRCRVWLAMIICMGVLARTLCSGKAGTTSSMAETRTID